MRSKVVRSVSTLIFNTLLFVTYGQFCHAQNSFIREKGIWRSPELDFQLEAENEKLLIDSLQRITGMGELRFNPNGSLIIGKTNHAKSGSPTARAILQRAIDSGAEFIIEQHLNSPAINFGQLDEGLRYENTDTNENFMIWRVRLDFADFRAMQTTAAVREAFDSGFTMLHELLHALGHTDPENVGEIGECETIINQVRTELGLPVREHYHGVPVMQIHQQAVTVRVTFRERLKHKIKQVTAPEKWKTHYLYFLMTVTDEYNAACLNLRTRKFR